MDGITRRQLLKTTGLAAAAAGLTGIGVPAFGADQKVSPGAVKDYELPKLPYAYDALEPHLTREILTFHHDKHHAAAVSGLKSALDQLAKLGPQDVAKANGLVIDVAYNGSSHVLHSTYWKSMRPNGPALPAGMAAEMINRDFGSYGNFAAQFKEVAAKIQGSGWAVLAYEPVGNRLVLLGVKNHQNEFFVNAMPIFVCDVWEHAYYLKYQNRRADYIAAFMEHLADFTAADEMLRAAVR